MAKSEGQTTTDKAGKSYWDKVWTNLLDTPQIDISGNNLNNHIDVAFFKKMDRFLKGNQAGSKKVLLEAGCGSSRWLPFFSQHYGFSIQGIDYSEEGCQKAQKALKQSDVEGDIFLADLFNLPENRLESADIVFSNGLIEHFSPTQDIIKALVGILRPGGLMITFIPNMTNLMGAIQKRLDHSVYDAHVPILREELQTVHEECGLNVLECSYVCSLNLSMVNSGSLQGRWWYPALIRLMAWISKVVWIMERLGMPELRNKFTSPYIVCIARKKG